MKHVVQPFPLKKVSKTHATPPAQLFLLKAIVFKFQKGSQNYWQINKEELFFFTFWRVVCGNCRWCGRPGTILVSKVWSTVHHFLSFNIVNGSVRLYKGHHAEAANQELPVPRAAHPTAKNPRYSCFCSRHNFTFSLRRFPTSPCLTAKKRNAFLQSLL